MIILDGFPTLYEDELLYSGLARYFVITLPTYINHVSAQIPYSLGYTNDHLIVNHTLFNFLTAFMSSDSAAYYYEQMSNPNSTHNNSNTTSKLLNVPFLRYCPICMESDYKLHGETYWHRSHQISLLNVCFRHRVFLVNSSVQGKRQGNLVSASKAIRDKVSPVYLNPDDPSDSGRYKLAEGAYWLLTHPKVHAIRERYRRVISIRKNMDAQTFSPRKLISNANAVLTQSNLPKIALGSGNFLAMERTSFQELIIPDRPMFNLMLLYGLDVDIVKFLSEDINATYSKFQEG